ncbi:hypothetical protein EBU94_09430, partial [bacterium]|nr:hypothetical protein [bacterium]
MLFCFSLEINFNDQIYYKEFELPTCPIKILDEQSGESKSQRSERGNIIDNNVFGKYKPQENTLRGHSDKGGASRFFYVAKASKSERNKGLEQFEEGQTKG